MDGWSLWIMKFAFVMTLHKSWRVLSHFSRANVLSTENSFVLNIEQMCNEHKNIVKWRQQCQRSTRPGTMRRTRRIGLKVGSLWSPAVQGRAFSRLSFSVNVFLFFHILHWREKAAKVVKERCLPTTTGESLQEIKLIFLHNIRLHCLHDHWNHIRKKMWNYIFQKFPHSIEPFFRSARTS